MIQDVIIYPLKVFSDNRGKVMHMLRKDVPFFNQFGEVYFSYINPDIVKGWKKHLKLTQHFAVPIGNIDLVMYDARKDSLTKDMIQKVSIGIDSYQLVRIPPMVCYSFKSKGNQGALIANCTDLPYDAEEVINIELGDESIPYGWHLK